MLTISAAVIRTSYAAVIGIVVGTLFNRGLFKSSLTVTAVPTILTFTATVVKSTQLSWLTEP